MSDGPFLTTERFDLWKPVAGDVQGLVELIAAPEMREFLGPARADASSQFERLLRAAGGWALYGYGVFYVRERGGTDLIGSCGVFHSWRGFGKGLDDVPEAGWVVRQDWWGKGVAGEVMRAAMSWFDEAHGPRRVACIIEEGNTSSERLAAKFGFKWYDSHRDEDGERVLLNLFERVPAGK